MTQSDFSLLDDLAVTKSAFDENLGFNRARAIVELANRALTDPSLLESACKAIASDRRIGFHKRAPVGWFGADHIFLSGQSHAIHLLLKEMDKWEPAEQEDLVRHWAGAHGLATLTHELRKKYGWVPRYELK